jgi:hypothetical protein
MESQKKSILQSNSGGPIALVLLAIGAYALYARYSDPHVNFEVRIDVTGTAKKVDIGIGTDAVGRQTLPAHALPYTTSFPAQSNGPLAITATNVGESGDVNVKVSVQVVGQNDGWQEVANRSCDGANCNVSWGGKLPERKLY